MLQASSCCMAASSGLTTFQQLYAVENGIGWCLECPARFVFFDGKVTNRLSPHGAEHLDDAACSKLDTAITMNHVKVNR